MKEIDVFRNDEFGSLTVISFNEESLFVGKEVATMLGYTDSSQAIRNHCKYAKLLRPVDLTGLKLPFEINPRGMTFVNEKDIYRLIMKSELPSAEKFQDWVCDEVLPSIRKTGTYSMGVVESRKDSFEMELLGLEYASKILKSSDVSKLQMLHHVYNENRVSTGALPVYVEKTRVTFSATDLLKKHNIDISAVAFNKLLIASGILEEKTRASTKSKSGVKTFKALTEKGLQYGQNDTNPKSPRETQPHYFEDTFRSLKIKLQSNQPTGLG